MNANVNIEDLIKAYEELNNVWKVGERFGLRGQYVHTLLTKAGAIHKMNYFTKEDEARLAEHYTEYRDQGRLEELAKMFGRTKHFICRKAKALGLTSYNHPISETAKDKLRESSKTYIKEHGHPKGMLGKKHSEENKVVFSKLSKERWAKADSPHRTKEQTQRRSDVMHMNRVNGLIKSHSNKKEISATIGERNFHFMSSWEYNIALMLEDMRKDGLISFWDYEHSRYIFHDVKQGIRSYMPDFTIVNTTGKTIHIEVKGWKMPIGMKRIEMFRERYPNETLHIIDKHEYRKAISQADYLRRYTQ